MRYLSHNAIVWAIRELRRSSHPFLGITYLACKKANLPVGDTREIGLDAVTRDHLEDHHYLDPYSKYYFQPFRSNRYWFTVEGYPFGSLHVTDTQTFWPVFIRHKGMSQWGFTEDYVDTIGQIVNILPGFGALPLDAIAIWTGKNCVWHDSATLVSIIAWFEESYHITEAERTWLFTLSDPLSRPAEGALFDDEPADLKFVAYEFRPPPDAPRERAGTLTAMHLAHIGPARKFALELGQRLTLIAGDNGLGKSFLLDVVWWTLTGKWATHPAMPFGKPRVAKRPTIRFEIQNEIGQFLSGSSYFDWENRRWITQDDRPSAAALCIYARADGSFAVSDRIRTKLQPSNPSDVHYLTSSEIWDGKSGEIEGLVRDWVNWQLAYDPRVFAQLTNVLECLSPDDLGPLVPGDPTRIPGDPRQMPTIRHPYGDIPIVFSSAGVQRTLLLAYVVIWSWQEHMLAAEQTGEEPLGTMVLVVDEIEAHLHPRWQRAILPALLRIAKMLSPNLKIQIVASTHSPMVLASVEPDFSDESDALYHLRLEETDVILEPLEFQKYGNFSAWLTSPVFGLRQARSRDAEQAIEEAKAVQLDRTPDVAVIQAVSDDLRSLLAPDDPFWPRWIYFAERFGVNL